MADTSQWHLRQPVLNNPIVFFGVALCLIAKFPNLHLLDMLKRKACAYRRHNRRPAGGTTADGAVCGRLPKDSRELSAVLHRGASVSPSWLALGPPQAVHMTPHRSTEAVALAQEKRCAAGLQRLHLSPDHKGLYDSGRGLFEGDP